MYKVNEIFLSVQGEGHRVGRLAVFVRFSGCARSCSFCDTRHDSWEDYSLDQLMHEVVTTSGRVGANIDCVLTGGEPLLQVDRPLLEALLDRGYRVCVETSADASVRSNVSSTGLLYALSELPVIVTSSPKDSLYVRGVLRGTTCLKLLVPLLVDQDEVREMVRLVGSRGEEVHLVLQPWVPKGISRVSWKWQEACVEARAFAKKRLIHWGEQWRLIPQTHVWMGFR